MVVDSSYSNDMRHIVDFGIFPDQKKLYVTKSQIGITLQEHTGAANELDAWHAGLRLLCDELLTHEFQSQTGTAKKIELVAVDGNWEQSTNTVYQIARQVGNGKILPIHGRARGAKQSSIDQFKVEQPPARDQVGLVSMVHVSSCILLQIRTT